MKRENKDQCYKNVYGQICTILRDYIFPTSEELKYPFFHKAVIVDNSFSINLYIKYKN